MILYLSYAISFLPDPINPKPTPPPTQVHVYELTHHEDNYDLRYRLKDKLYLPSATTPATSSLATTPPSILSSSIHARTDNQEVNNKPGMSQARGDRSGDATSGRSEAAAAAGGGKADQAGATANGGSAAFLLVTSGNVVLCDGRVLQLYDFTGFKVIKNV